MKKLWIGVVLLISIIGTAMAAGGVTVISANGVNGAWIGYSDGTVRFCTGGGGTAIPFWTRCTIALEQNGSAVTDISNNENRAWIGHANGKMRYCRESGSDQDPETECIDVKS